MNKTFFICDCSKSRIKSVKHLRELSENIFQLLGYQIGEFAIRFGNTYKSISYSSKKKERFDELSFDKIELAQFYLFPTGGLIPFDLKCSLDFSKNKEGDFSITCVFIPQETKNTICDTITNLADEIICILENLFTIRYFCMDEMENIKRPERFVFGIVSEDVRNDLENSVAHSIQLSHLIHHKLPYLFLYNHFYSEQRIAFLDSKRLNEKENYCYEIFFPENCQRSFSEYSESKKWNQIYKNLTELGVVKLGG